MQKGTKKKRVIDVLIFIWINIDFMMEWSLLMVTKGICTDYQNECRAWLTMASSVRPTYRKLNLLVFPKKKN
jgi:hypothetical protein